MGKEKRVRGDEGAGRDTPPTSRKCARTPVARPARLVPGPGPSSPLAGVLPVDAAQASDRLGDREPEKMAAVSVALGADFEHAGSQGAKVGVLAVDAAQTSERLGERELADVGAVWAALGADSGNAGSKGASVRPSLTQPDAQTSRADIKAALAAVWTETERRREALLVLFSKHADLTPAAAEPVMRARADIGWPGYLSRAGYSGIQRRLRSTTSGGPAPFELEALPDALLSYIYSFAPQKVCRDLAVCRRFLRCLTKTERVCLTVKCGADVPLASLMRFQQAVHLTGRRCWGLVDTLITCLTNGWAALVVLDLSDNELDDESVARLSVALQRSTNLTSLALGDNKITRVGAGHLGHALAQFGSLQQLHLSGNRVGCEGVRRIANGLRLQGGIATRLTHLGLGGAGSVGEDGIKELVSVFLPSLALSGEGGGAGMAGDIAERRGKERSGEERTRVLTKLDFSACSLSGPGMRALAPLIAWNSGLQELTLSRNDLEAGGAKVLAPVLPSSLTELNLNFNNLGVEGARALVPALERMHSLKHLKLFGNQFGLEGAEVLTPALTGMTSLSSLYLSLNNIDAKNKSMIAGALRPRLRTFHI